MLLTVKRMTFDRVEIRATRRWSDPETGRRRQETKTFFQTLNPLNRNDDGSVKSRHDVVQELKAERDAWLASFEQEV